MKKPKGLNRRRRYECCECLGDIWEFPYYVMDGGIHLRCEACQKKDEAR